MPLTRHTSVTSSWPASLPSFILDPANRSYKQQYSNIYFQRLHALRIFVEGNAMRKWQGVKGNPILVPRVLDVKKGQLCWIIGTAYMDMALKPNILEEIGKDFSIPPPPPVENYRSLEDSIVLEDESGRINLVGECLKREQFVTGIVMAALGIETPTGEFEVIDLCFAGMAPHANFAEPTNEKPGTAASNQSRTTNPGSWIAFLSGLELSTSHSPSSETELRLQLLIEHILSESGGLEDQALSSQISRVVIVGNSMLVDEDNLKSHRNHTPGIFPAPLASPVTSTISKVIHDIALGIPIHLLPGASDPSGIILPQQPMPRAMFGYARQYESFRCETNPTWLMVDGKSILAVSGQTLDDMYKYLESNDRLALAVRTLYWRHMAPTAPDTLWCYPYFLNDPFVMSATPHIYVVGNQPSFATRLVTATLSQPQQTDQALKRDRESDLLERENIRCRVVLLPKFCDCATLVLVNTSTLECKAIEVGVDVGLLPQ